jgi:hypothetical protein
MPHTQSFQDYMKRTTGLLLLLPLILLVESSCSVSPSQRRLVEFPRKDGPRSSAMSRLQMC